MVARKPPSLTGVAVVCTWRGKIYIRKWPKKRTKPLPPNQQRVVTWFTETNRLFKRLPAEDQQWYRDQREGLALYPRDIFLANQAGALFYLTTLEGKKLLPANIKAKVTESLDVFQPDLGDMLFRGEHDWEVVPAGTDGQILVFRDATTKPGWETPVAGTGLWKEIGSYSVASGVIDVQGLTLTAYEEIQIRIQNLNFSGTKDHLRFRFYMGGTLITSGYRYRTEQLATNGNNDTSNSTSAGQIHINSSNTGWEVSTSGKAGISGTIAIANPSGGQNKVSRFTGETNFDGGNCGIVDSVGNLDNTSAITGFRLYGGTYNLAGGRAVLLGRD